jgi:uncharacterized protein (TIGR00725 family)
MPSRKAQAAVIGDSDAPAEICSLAEAIGTMLARHGITLITGGGSGVMEAAGKGARNAAGITVGIIPGDSDMDANPSCSVVIPTGLGHARNIVTVLAGDFVIALGGAAGTMSEICFAWIHGKPILALENCDGWAARVASTRLDHRRPDPIIACKDLPELEEETLALCRKMGLEFIE